VDFGPLFIKENLMAKWVNSINQDAALVKAWNGAGHGQVRSSHTLTDTANTAAMCYLELTEALTDGQRALFKELLTSDALDDPTRLSLLAQLRTKIVDIELDGGVTPPSGMTSLPNKKWRFVQECKLRCDDA
jgi:hypothetical protein